MKTYKKYFQNKTIIVTGHTGFKGSWISFILWLFGAKIVGISSYDLGFKSNYNLLKIRNKIHKEFKVDINDFDKLKSIFIKTKPDFVFHLAAQSLVSNSVTNPLKTFNTNVIGTTNILESLRFLKKKCSAVIITSDKCYLNKEIQRGYVETDVLGGIDPYSASKASAEIVFNSYYNTYFKNNKYIYIATARAGNVIGGGDFSQDRIIPDVIKSIISNSTLKIRSPKSTRPWQHVLEPLRGYIDLSINLHQNFKNSGVNFNFGPRIRENFTVIEIIKMIKFRIPNLKVKIDKSFKIKESGLLRLNCKKANQILNWKPYLNTKQSINLTIDWYLDYINKKNIEELTLNQINNYFEKNNFK